MRKWSGFPIAGGQETAISRHITSNTGETWEGNPIESQRIHNTCSLRARQHDRYYIDDKTFGLDLKFMHREIDT